MNLISPEVRVMYGETSSGIGGVSSEIVTLMPDNLSGVMQEMSWGDWLNGQITRTEYFNVEGDLLGGIVLLTVPDASILQIFTGDLQYVINRSRLYLVYIAPIPGERPVLSYAIYNELWGVTEGDVWAMGGQARWDDPNMILSPQYQRWGFWETSASPFDQVTQAISDAQRALIVNPPDILIQDEDSASEFIGRQTGFHVYTNGAPIGTIDFEYWNFWGRQPNTSIIGDGALSRVDWNLSTGNYTLLVLSAQLQAPDMVASSLYVFMDNPAYVDEVRNTAFPLLYEKIRSGNQPGVVMAVYASGDLSTATASGSTSEETVTVDVGITGGIYYATVNDPTWEDVELCRRLLSMLGQSGLKALGMYFPHAPGSGSGLNYYLSITSLVVAPRDRVLNEWGMDVGILDRVGHPELP
jgi:hypothetical protein